MSTKIFVFLNFPVGGKPYVDKIYKSTPFLENIFSLNKENYLKKRDLERLGIVFPAGPRYLMLPHELPRDFENYSPSGPDIIDIVSDRYIKEQKEEREKKELK